MDIQSVLREHEGRLLELPNVRGVAIGVSEQTGKEVIKVYLTREGLALSPPTRALIPSELGGFEVVVEAIGGLQALKGGDSNEEGSG